MEGPSDPVGVVGQPVGDTATWQIGTPASVDNTSTEIEVEVTRLACSSGVTGNTLPPVVSYEPHQIVIHIDVEPFGDAGGNCQGNNPVPVVVTLDEPVGERTLVDGSCLAGDAVGTAPCLTTTRWPV